MSRKGRSKLHLPAEGCDDRDFWIETDVEGSPDKLREKSKEGEKL